MIEGRGNGSERTQLGRTNAGVSVWIDSGSGALLTSDQFNTFVLDQGGNVLLGELSDPQIGIQDLMTVSDGKVAAYVVLGPPGEGDVEINFFLSQGDAVVNDTTTLAKATPDDGTILYSWSARPTGTAGQWIEAYKPGSEIARPMVLDLFLVENGSPVRAPEDVLRPVFVPTGCPAGTVLTPGVDPPETGQWATGLQLGMTPGRCWLTASIEEYQDGAWQPALTTRPSASVWAVEMEMVTPLPDVILAMDDTPAREETFTYQIQPLDFEPHNTAVVFEDQGKEVGIAQASGRGPGTLTLAERLTHFSRAKPAGVHLEVNRGVVWGIGGANSVPLKLKSQSYPLNLVEIEMKIVPDWNRDKVIDAEDEGQATDERPLRWWINDDDDDGDISDRQTTYLPLLDSDDDDLPGRTAYTFPRLADERDTCGSTLLEGAYEADTIEVDNTGAVLMPSFLDLINQNPDKGIVLVEGAAATTSPLYLEILKNARVVERAELPLSISGVEQMFRWINLRHVICGWECESRYTDVGEPNL